jgi:hypothetical protein
MEPYTHLQQPNNLSTQLLDHISGLNSSSIYQSDLPDHLDTSHEVSLENSNTRYSQIVPREHLNQAPDQEQVYIPPSQADSSAIEVPVAIDLRTRLVQKIHSLKRRLGRGWYKVYTFWLLLMMALTILVLVRETIYFIEYLVDFGLYAWDFIALIAVVFACIWHFRQCWYEIQAISSRSLKKAKRALKLMVGFTIYFFVFVALVYVFYIPSFSIIFKIYDDGGLFLVFLACWALFISITVAGAKKVSDVLEKIGFLQMRLDSNMPSVVQG